MDRDSTKSTASLWPPDYSGRADYSRRNWGILNDPNWPRDMTSAEIAEWISRLAQEEAQKAARPQDTIFERPMRRHRAISRQVEVLEEVSTRDTTTRPRFTAAVLEISPDPGVYVSSWRLRTAAEINDIASKCSDCGKTIIDLHHEWWTQATWVKPDKSRDERGKNKLRHGRHTILTTRRFCRKCHEKWIGYKEVRTKSTATVVGPKRSYKPHQNMMAAILSKLPSDCRGAILRQAITARPPVMLKSDLINQVLDATGYRPDVVRKTVNKLIADKSLEPWPPAGGPDVPEAVLGVASVQEFRIETVCDRRRTAIFRLELSQRSAPKDTPDTLAAAFRDRKARWVVGCTIVENTIEEKKEKLDFNSIDDAFAMADLIGLNPYSEADPDDPEVDNPVYDDPDCDDELGGLCRTDRDWQQRRRDHPGTIPSPDVLAELAEHHAARGGWFASSLIGTTQHEVNEWSPETPPAWSPALEQTPPTESCDVCGHHPDRPRQFWKLQACLGCLRSGSDNRIAMTESDSTYPIYVPRKTLDGDTERHPERKPA